MKAAVLYEANTPLRVVDVDQQGLPALRRSLSRGPAQDRSTREPHLQARRDLLPRIWELRHHVTAYDAAYLSLAEALPAPLLTRDRALATPAAHRARVELI